MPSRAIIDRVHNLARPTGGAVRRAMLVRAGVTPGEVRSLLGQGHLTKVFPGTYLVAGARLDQETCIQCCLVHAGPDSAVSHRSGMELRAVLRSRPGRLTVTTKRGGLQARYRTLIRLENGSFGLLEVHEESPEIEFETALVGGVRATLFERTMVDTAGSEPAKVVGWAWREAEYLALLDVPKLHAELGHRRSGSGAIRQLLADHPPLTSPGDDIRSRREIALLAVVRAAGLPMPEKNAYMRIAGTDYWADAFWRAIGLVVEVDGPQHDLPSRRDEDRVHDVEFAAVGLAVIRFSTRRLLSHRDWCADRLAKVYAQARLRALAASK